MKTTLAIIGAIALVLVALYVLITLASIVLPAARDTLKYRAHHLKPGYRAWHLAYVYPVVFAENLKDQVEAWWGDYETESSPVAPDRENTPYEPTPLKSAD